MLEEFLIECCRINGLVFTVGNRSAVGELEIKEPLEPMFEGGAMHLAAGPWGAHLNMKDVVEVRFVKAKESKGLIPFLLMAVMLDRGGTSLFTLFFPNPWLGDDHLPVAYQEERMVVFEGIKHKYTAIGPDFFTYSEQ